MTASTVQRHVSKSVAALLGLLFVGLLVTLEKSLCPSANVLGLPCPGCGMTRAIALLLTGDGPAAIHLHPLSPCVATAGLIYATVTAVGRIWPTARLSANFLSTSTRTSFAILFCGAMVLVWGLRFFNYLGGPAPVEPLWGQPLLDISQFG